MGGISWEGRLPNQPLREALLAALDDGMTLSEVCYKMGWTRPGTNGRTAETAGLKRCLGIEATRYKNRQSGAPHATYVSTVKIERAKGIAAALGLDIDELYDGLLPEELPAALCRTCDSPMLRPDPEGTCGFCQAEVALFGRVAVAA